MGKTIQIFMPYDEPRGIRLASVTNRIIQTLVIPRRRLADALNRPESNHVAVYFLFGESTVGSQSSVYIGETEDIPGRLRDHNARKDFWNTAIIAVAEARFTKAHVKYLEWMSIQRATEAGRFDLENSNQPQQPFLPEPQIADCVDAFETIDTLLSALGYPLFEGTRPSVDDSEGAFFCNRSGADATGQLTDDGFVVFEGSKALCDDRPSSPPSIVQLRQQLRTDGILEDSGGAMVFTQDYIFRSPSTAAAVVVGGSANGWVEWRNGQGKTLDDVYRQVQSGDV